MNISIGPVSGPRAWVIGMVCLVLVVTLVRMAASLTSIREKLVEPLTARELNAAARRLEAAFSEQSLADLNNLSHRLEAMDRSAGFSGSVLMVLGVCLGLVGSFTSDWVLHGVWSVSGPDVGVRLAVVVIIALAVSGLAGFGLMPVINRRVKQTLPVSAEVDAGAKTT